LNFNTNFSEETPSSRIGDTPKEGGTRFQTNIDRIERYIQGSEESEQLQKAHKQLESAVKENEQLKEENEKLKGELEEKDQQISLLNVRLEAVTLPPNLISSYRDPKEQPSIAS